MLSLLPSAHPEESDWFTLAADVGRNRPNRRDDAIKVEGLLANDGDPELRADDGPSGRWGAALDAALADGGDPLVAFASPQATFRPVPGLPVLRQADRDSNTSQLDWLDRHQVGLGEVPAQFARYVGLGPQGIAQARDFVLQFQRRWPGERDALVDGILDRLDPAGQTSFLGAPRPQGALPAPDTQANR